ncbi:hypothetical protein LTR17_005194 [Elasticomyces elasticus]|nr:hypothetical protein LTR17_005194 [Elasticomyces elasticus]
MTSTRNKRKMPDDGQQQASKRTKLQYTDAFTVLVGAEEEKFIVHASIATKHSKFFQAACNGGFKEAEEKTIRLPETTPATFRAYLQWAYSGSVVMVDEEELKADVTGAESRWRLTKLYVLANFLANTPLQNNVIDEYVGSLLSNAKYGTGPRCLKLAYEHTPTGSSLRRLFVEDWRITIRRGKNVKWFQVHRDEIPVEFQGDLIIALVAIPEPVEKGFALMRPCKYHEHNDEYPQCKA